MSEELTKDQLNLVKVLNYCLETKHDFAGARSNKNTKHYAKEIIDCVNLPPILDKTSDNFESNIMTEFGLDIDSIQRDNYMESQMVQSVFLNPKTYNPKISLEENLEVWAYNHAIKYTDDEGVTGSSPENLYRCKVVMGELELDRDEVKPASEIYEKIETFTGESNIIVDTIPSNFSYLYNKLIMKKSKQPFTKDWDPATLTGNELSEEELGKSIIPSTDVRKIYNQESVNVLKDFSKKVLNIVPVYSQVIEGGDDNQTKNCSIEKGEVNSNYCIIRNSEDSDIPENAQLLLLFKNNDEADFSFNIDSATHTYKLPIDIENDSKTYITSGYSVKELSSGIGLFVGLRKEIRSINEEFNETECDVIKEKIETMHSRSNKLDKKGLLLAWNIIDSILHNKDALIYNDSPLTTDDALQYGILIMLDLKKAGDWGLVDYCRRTGSVLLTVDRLCGLYALINNVSVIFSGSFYPDYKTWVVYKGSSEISLKTGIDIKRILAKNIESFNAPVKKHLGLIEQELSNYRDILNQNCEGVSGETFKPKSSSKFKDASVKYEFLKKAKDLHQQNHIIVESPNKELGIKNFIVDILDNVRSRLLVNFGSRTNSLLSDDESFLL